MRIYKKWMNKLDHSIKKFDKTLNGLKDINNYCQSVKNF